MAGQSAEEAELVGVAKSRPGERIHPATGREMIYVACEVIDGEAHAADVDEVAAVAWCRLDEIPEYVPYGFYEPVQEYLDALLSA
jgi:8-oxo-dGTP diphosphatase